ncbi:multicopper oxidase family protein [Plantactinospora endophytica]|uniref:Multicopper oxidase n=1 Tax=Plantactinospora endophytica TaxID=673535 RepID=A0ABQ4E7T8_9ACTN|nr:multicopper oxidase domain-containing protein [Plantactinospora endophytica]GIG90790.1 multicopper oxidase [Plantactinospora endophytica]
MAGGGSRRWLAVLLGVCSVLLLLCGVGTAVGTWVWTSNAVDTSGKVDFVNRLAVPPLAQSRIDDRGRRVFDLRAQPGRRDFGQGGPTDTWGFNGDYLGPTLRANRGEQVVVNVVNGIGEPTSVHWHGMHLPAAMDGGPHQMVRPGATWSPHWTVDQPAATLWYHPHPHGRTAEHVYRGMAGMFLLDDEPSAGLPLPRRYGVDDIPVIVQDRKFESDGRLDTDQGGIGGTGILGDTLLVNGTVGPYLDVSTERVRLRLLNGSNARTYDFGFADDRTFALVGTDGGLLERPHRTGRIRLSPGERAEIVVTVRPAERAVLRSYPPNQGLEFLGGRFTGGDDTFDVLELRAGNRLAPSPEVPDRLTPVERLDPATATETRRFRLNGREINGRKMDLDRIDFAVTRGATEIWEIEKQDATPHSFHVHDVQFQVLSVDGRQPPPELRGWKDTILVTGGEEIRIIARFADHADPNMPYMFHCHLLLHEDQGMMGQFVVVEPGQRAGRPPSGHGHAEHR